MSVPDFLIWHCAGCGASAEGKTKPCDCATNVGTRTGPNGKREQTWWEDPPDPAADQITCLRTALADMQRERDELQEGFDLRWKADMRAIRQWQESNPGNDLVWPDHADLCVWLTARATAAEAKLAKHVADLDALLQDAMFLRNRLAALDAMPQEEGAP